MQLVAMQNGIRYNVVLIVAISLLAGCGYTLIQSPKPKKSPYDYILDDGRPLPVIMKDQCINDTTKPVAPSRNFTDEYEFEFPPDMRLSKSPIRRVWPQFYPDTLGLRKDATVWVTSYIDSMGDVTCACIAKSNEVPEINNAVLRAALQWKFRGSTYTGGKIIAGWITIPFRLNVN